MMKLLRSPCRLGAALLLLALGACGGGNENKAYIEKPVDDLYNNAMDQLASEDYGKAAGTFQQVESQHPYSVWATKSQMMEIYADYENG
jgi:outer membrane protein assembly factor BamD